MKYTFTLLSLLVALQFSAQVDMTAYENLFKEISITAATPPQFDTDRPARSGLELTHNLDSIVQEYGLSESTGKQVMEYNANGTTHRIEQYGLDSNTLEIQLQGIYTFGYEGSSLPSNLFVEAWNNDTQQFEETIGMEIWYTGAQRIDTVLVSFPDPLSGEFGPLLGLKYQYNGDLLVQSKQWFYLAFLGEWIPASFTDFQYDAQDRLIDQQTTLVDFGTGEFIPDTRTTYDYNVNDARDTIERFLWVDPSWEATDRDVIEYHPNVTVKNNFHQLFDGSGYVNNTWTNNPLENLDDEIIVLISDWILPDNLWKLMDSSNHILNPSLQWSQVAAPRELSVLSLLGDVDGTIPFLEDGPVRTESHYFVADSTTKDLAPFGDDYYYYSLRDGSGVSEVLPEYLSINPNPAVDHFTILIDQDIKAEYVVYASNGMEKIRGIAHQGSNSIRTSSWPQGMYYVIITLEDGSTFAHKQLIH